MSKRSRSPEKSRQPKVWFINESYDDEYEKLDEILEDEDSQRGDIIHFMSSNIFGAKWTTIIKVKGKKQISGWKYADEDSNYFGIVL